MLDARFVADQPDTVKDHLRRRNASPEAFEAEDTVGLASKRRGALITERDGLLNRRNVLSKDIGALMKAGKREDAEGIKAQVNEANARVAAIEVELDVALKQLDDALMQIPNLLHERVATGASEDENEVVGGSGVPPEFDFEPKDHVALGEALGILDLEGGAKLSGARFWVLKGLGARLERALISFFLDIHTTERGYTELMVPYIVSDKCMRGTGQLPKFGDDMFKLANDVNGSPAYLIPTAEVPVTNLHREEILDEADLPKKYAAFTPCFRAEAGSAGRDVRGLIRVHQFHKVELVWITTPEKADEAHEALVSDAERLLQRLRLPYRVSALCSGDIGFNAHRCFDLEVWLPSQEKYREISSCSQFSDYQARRMQLRYRPTGEDAKKAKPKLCATLNGSALAVGRTVVAILENYQQKDGSVVIPEALRPYMGGLEVIR